MSVVAAVLDDWSDPGVSMRVAATASDLLERPPGPALDVPARLVERLPEPEQLFGSSDPALTGPAGAEVARLRALAKASNTRRVYTSRFRGYLAWCAAAGLDPVCRDGVAVAHYLAERGKRCALSTLEVDLAAIAFAHRRAGVPFDAATGLLAEVRAGLVREKTRRPQRQATALLLEPVQTAAAGLPDTAFGLRDRAILLLGFGAALRRSELAGLDRNSLRIDARGLELEILRSKADQEGAGALVAVTRARDPAVCPVAAVMAWLRYRGDAPGPLFTRLWRDGRRLDGRLSDKQINRIVQSAFSRVDPGVLGSAIVSAHGLRAGFATEAVNRGVDLLDFMRHLRQSSVNSARRYYRQREAWQRNASQAVFAGQTAPLTTPPSPGADERWRKVSERRWELGMLAIVHEPGIGYRCLVDGQPDLLAATLVEAKRVVTPVAADE